MLLSPARQRTSGRHAPPRRADGERPGRSGPRPADRHQRERIDLGRDAEHRLELRLDAQVIGGDHGAQPERPAGQDDVLHRRIDAGAADAVEIVALGVIVIAPGRVQRVPRRQVALVQAGDRAAPARRPCGPTDARRRSSCAATAPRSGGRDGCAPDRPPRRCRRPCDTARPPAGAVRRRGPRRSASSAHCRPKARGWRRRAPG